MACVMVLVGHPVGLLRWDALMMFVGDVFWCDCDDVFDDVFWWCCCVSFLYDIMASEMCDYDLTLRV